MRHHSVVCLPGMLSNRRKNEAGAKAARGEERGITRRRKMCFVLLLCITWHVLGLPKVYWQMMPCDFDLFVLHHPTAGTHHQPKKQ